MILFIEDPNNVVKSRILLNVPLFLTFILNELKSLGIKLYSN
jgi:hypothetical protein